MKDVYITDYKCVTPLGFDVLSNWNALIQGRSGVESCCFPALRNSFFVAKIDDKKLEEEFNLSISNFNATRLEKMLILSLKDLVKNHDISEKTALILSTTKGNISSIRNKNIIPAEAYLGNLAQRIADFFGFKMKPIVVSNACVSGVLAVSVAKNMIAAGICNDAYVVAGDEVSDFVVSGFNAFKAISSNICKPYDYHREGINLGEAAAACYITHKVSGSEKTKFKILGESAINDANHISGPSRTGEGLFKSVENALTEAGKTSEEIDFISAHGTATLYNDEMESVAFSRAALSEVPMHSLKAFFGHTLGASGLLESIIAMECSKNSLLIPSKNFSTLGVSHPLNIIKENTAREISLILKTASGFGGCNAALILEKHS